MPHQCVKCSRLYEDASSELLKGCSDCGGRFFFFMKKQDIKQVQEITSNLTKGDKEQLEKDALDLVGDERIDQPVILDLENVRMLKPGKYEIDLVDVFKGDPLVYKLEDGKYVIDIATTFKTREKN